VKGEPPRSHGEVVPASDVRDVRSHGEVVPASDVQDVRGGLARHEEPVSPDLLTASFPIAMRGYRREAVDSHIERLNRVIAELEMNRSPRSAVRAALDRVGEQTAGILRQARRAAEEIVTQAREEADEITGRATAEARELIVDVSDDADRVRAEAAEQVRSATEEADALLAAARQEAERVAARAQTDADDLRRHLSEELEARRAEAETKMLELRADTDSVREERYELLAEIRQFADQAKALASEAVERLPDGTETLTEDRESALDQNDKGVGQVAADGERADGSDRV
jgi:cell division septum initiation protein DivIVA